MNLEAELKRVRRLISAKATQINNKANARGVFYSGVPLVKKIEDISQILDDEIGRLVPNFTSKKDLENINKFIDEQKQFIYRSAETHGLAQGVPLSELDARTEELKGIISNKRFQTLKKTRGELMRFWTPVAISIAALVMSILSLVMAGNYGE